MPAPLPQVHSGKFHQGVFNVVNLSLTPQGMGSNPLLPPTYTDPDDCFPSSIESFTSANAHLNRGGYGLFLGKQARFPFHTEVPLTLNMPEHLGRTNAERRRPSRDAAVRATPSPIGGKRGSAPDQNDPDSSPCSIPTQSRSQTSAVRRRIRKPRRWLAAASSNRTPNPPSSQST